MDISLLNSILCVFLIALFVTVLFRQLRLSVILGYLLVGSLVGPHALALIPDSETIRTLAECGIVFLMFTIGLEFSLSKLFALKYSVFIMGGLQVIFSILVTAFIGTSLGMSLAASMIVGGVVAMSSTALVVKQLNDQRELYSPHGLNAIGILLFQDLAVIPIIILISSFSSHQQEPYISLFSWSLLKGIIAIFLIFTLGRWLLRPLFQLIAKTRAIELFTLTVLVVTLIAAWLTYQLGLSYALGAFLAGMMLGETEFRHQIEVEIRPFRDILLGLFFITIGMLADFHTWPQTWRWITLLLSALIVGKLILITLLTRLAKFNWPVSLRTGLVLAQGGEFGFAILTLGITQKLIPVDYGQVILAALLLSIVISPLIIFFNSSISRLFLEKETKQYDESIEKNISDLAKNLNQHIILCGYGRVGQHITRLLEKIKIPYLGLDLDAELIHKASLAGDNVIYGDATHPAILKAAGLDHAKVLVISLNDIESAIKILSFVQQSHPALPILIRCRDEHELSTLKDLGAKLVFAELYEESITISHQLMQLLKIPADQITTLIQDVRNKDYELLKKIYAGSFEEDNYQE